MSALSLLNKLKPSLKSNSMYSRVQFLKLIFENDLYREIKNNRVSLYGIYPQDIDECLNKEDSDGVISSIVSLSKSNIEIKNAILNSGDNLWANWIEIHHKYEHENLIF